MLKRIILLGAAGAFMISLVGCSTSRNKDLEIQGLRNQVNALKTQPVVESEEIISEETVEVPAAADKVSETKDVPSARQIQAALKNAGYYSGAIDGKIGRQSRQAIRDFQKANNLMVDGKVGKKTWAALKEYLQKKVK